MRNHLKVAGLALVLMLALSLIAASQTSPQNAPSGSSATQSQTPSQNQTAPQQPAATPGSSSGTAQQGSASQPGSVQDELQLTEVQKQQLRPIIEDEINQINAVRNDQSLSMDQKREKVEKIRQTQFPKIQAILTPEQISKLKEMQQKAKQQQGTPPSSPQQPPH